tara:strand:- start:1039 stop:1410 length:372 start_codon:yes stop_codon:yes gene_type:complete
MTHALIITAKLSGGLTYSDNDVVQVLDGHQNPGSAVTPTDSGFLFCYISDKEHDDPEVMALMQPWEEGSDDPDEPPVQLAKRRYQVTLTGSEFETWVEEEEAEAAGIEKTWAEIQAITTDKEA